jgi:hypothetical protein
LSKKTQKSRIQPTLKALLLIFGSQKPKLTGAPINIKLELSQKTCEKPVIKLKRHSEKQIRSMEGAWPRMRAQTRDQGRQHDLPSSSLALLVRRVTSDSGA